jgi:hypothetical protein
MSDSTGWIPNLFHNCLCFFICDSCVWMLVATLTLNVSWFSLKWAKRNIGKGANFQRSSCMHCSSVVWLLWMKLCYSSLKIKKWFFPWEVPTTQNA